MQECLAVLAVILTKRRELITSGMILENHQHWHQAVKWVNHGLIIKTCFTVASFLECKMYANMYEKEYTWDFYFYSLRRFCIMVDKDVMEETLRRVTRFQTQFMKDFSWSGKSGGGAFSSLDITYCTDRWPLENNYCPVRVKFNLCFSEKEGKKSITNKLQSRVQPSRFCQTNSSSLSFTSKMSATSHQPVSVYGPDYNQWMCKDRTN